MAILFDFILLAIGISCIVLCCRRGFVRSLIEATGGMFAAFFAYLFAKPAGRWLNDRFVRALVENRITERLQSITGTSAPLGETDLSGLLTDAPEPFRRLLTSFNVELDSVRAASAAEQTVAARSRAVVEEIAARFSSVLATCLCFAVFFAILLVAVFLLGKLASGISYIPVIGKFNRVFGALFGTVKALVLICVFTAILHLLLPYLVEPMHLDPDDPYKGSVLCEPITAYNPLVGLLPTDFVKDS